MNPLPAPAQGLIVYQTDGMQGYYYNLSTTTIPDWVLLANENSTQWNVLKDPTSASTIDHGAFRTNFTFNGATESGAFNISSNSLTKSSLLDLNVLTTNGASGYSTTVLDLFKSGANINSNHKSYGISSRVSNTDNSSTNIAGYFSSSCGTINFSLLVPPDGRKV